MNVICYYTVSFALAAAATVQAASPSPNTPLTATVPPGGKKVTIKALPAGPCAVADVPVCEFKAIVTDETNTPLSGVPVSFYLKGTKIGIGSTTTKADGSAAVLQGIHVDTLAIGQNSFEARVDSALPGTPVGGALPTPGPVVKSIGTVTITKGSCKISFHEIDQKPKPPDSKANSLSVEAILYLKNPGLLPGRKLSIAFAGRTFEATTNSGGSARVQIPLSVNDLTAYKTSQMTASFTGDDQLLACSAAKEVHLQQLMPKAWGYSVYGDPTFSPKVQLGQTVRIKVHFHAADPPYAPVANMPFTVVGYNYKHTVHLGSGVSDAQGNGTIYFHHTNPVEPGTYPMQVRFNNNGQEYVNNEPALPGDARESLIILPTDLDVNVTAPKTAVPGDPVTITVQAARRTDHAPAVIQMLLRHEDMYFNPVAETSDNQGKAVFTVKMPKTAGKTSQAFELMDYIYPANMEKYYNKFVKKFSIGVAGPHAPVMPGGTTLQLK